MKAEPDDMDSSLDDDRGPDEEEGMRPAPPWQAWLETAALAGLSAAAGVIADFEPSWLALAPLLAGVRYGSCLGVACAAAQAAALIAAARVQSTIDVPAAQAMLGWLIAGLVPGQFRDAWNRRLRRLETRARDARRRLEGLARAYHLVSASHDRLQRELPGSPSCLRDVLEAFARDLLEPDAAAGSPTAGAGDGGGDGAMDLLESHGGRILTLFRVHTSVRAATLHRVDADRQAGPAMAVLGGSPMETARGDDPLIRQAARLGEVVSVRDVRDLFESAATLVAVPLVDVGGTIHAVVAVRELPFLSLHEDTLTLFAVLGGRLGDLLSRAHDVARAVVEEQPSRAFCATVSRSLVDARRHGIPHALAIAELKTFTGTHHEQRLLARCLAAHRRLTDDAEIVIDRDGTLRILFLLRLASDAGLTSYLARIERLARIRAEELGTDCHIQLRGWSLDDVPLPARPRDLEAALSVLVKSALSSPAALPSSSASSSQTSRRHHDVLA
jgi:polysaccharide biosynthesis protein PelD